VVPKISGAIIAEIEGGGSFWGMGHSQTGSRKEPPPEPLSQPICYPNHTSQTAMLTFAHVTCGTGAR